MTNHMQRQYASYNSTILHEAFAVVGITIFDDEAASAEQ